MADLRGFAQGLSIGRDFSEPIANGLIRGAELQEAMRRRQFLETLQAAEFRQRQKEFEAQLSRDEFGRTKYQTELSMTPGFIPQNAPTMPLTASDLVPLPGGGYFSREAANKGALDLEKRRAELETQIAQDRFKTFGGLSGIAQPIKNPSGEDVGYTYPDPKTGFPAFHGTSMPAQIAVATGPGGVTWANPKNPSQMQTVPLPEGATPTSKITAGGGGPVDPKELQGALNVYRETGSLPPFGMGKSALRSAVFAALGSDTGAQIVSEAQQRKAERAGMSKAYGTQQNLYQAEKTSLGTLDKQLGLALEYSKKVDRTGIPAFNKYLLAAKGQIAGDKDTAAFQNIVTTTANEFAKILSGASASIAGVTVSSAEDAKNLLNTASTPEQFIEIVNLMKQEGQFRLEARKETIDDLGKELGNIGAGGGETSGVTKSGIKFELAQ